MDTLIGDVTMWAVVAERLFQVVLTGLGVAADTKELLSGVGELGTKGLFRQCFLTAVKRKQPDLADYTELRDQKDVRVDEDELDKVIQNIDGCLTLEAIGTTKESMLDALVPSFARCVKLGGSHLTGNQMANLTRDLLDVTCLDFVANLVKHSPARTEAELAHYAKTDAAQQETLRRIQDIQERLSRQPYLDPAVIQQESSRAENRNPFRIVKAEEFDHNYQLLAQLFHEPVPYELIRGPDNLILEGGRGCGKSMILRSLEAPVAIRLASLRNGGVQSDRSIPTFPDSGINYFGVYIKLAQGYFYEWSPDCKLSNETATQLFQHVFNLISLRALIDALDCAKTSGILEIPTAIEGQMVGDLASIAGVASEGTFRDLCRIIRAQERHVRDFVCSLRLGTSAAQYAGTHTSIHNFLEECCGAVQHAIQALRKCRIYFLLDEFENLREFQQQVINTLAKLRPLSLSLKIATRPRGVKILTDLQGEPIQSPRDYQRIKLDYPVEKPEYRHLLLEIGRRRLTAEGYKDTDLRKLLPRGPSCHPATEEAVRAEIDRIAKDSGTKTQDEQELFHRLSEAVIFRLFQRSYYPRTYAGFEEFEYLSSGIVSNFIELCKMAFYLADIRGIAVREGTPIPWELQNEAVYSTSTASVNKIPGNIPRTGPTVSNLLHDLAQIVRDKLLNHSSEPLASRIIIKDPERLNEDGFCEVKQALDDAVRWSVFHASGSAESYGPRHSADVQSQDYIPNRILAPALRISARPRWRTEVSVKDIFGLISPTTRQRTMTSLLRRRAIKSRNDDDRPILTNIGHQET